MPVDYKSRLPRLSREFYRGHAFVFWTHTFEHRASGWLDDQFHHHFREVMLHASTRYALACPTYVLMPDHWHLVWTGLATRSDQRLATAFMRQHLKHHLRAAVLQDRPHDHVLRDNERECGAFQNICNYVRENPVRAGLCTQANQWSYTGAIVAGYPSLDHNAADFWTTFWKVYNRLIEPPAPPEK